MTSKDFIRFYADDTALFDWLNDRLFKSFSFFNQDEVTFDSEVEFWMQVLRQTLVRSTLHTFVTVLGDDMSSHLWLFWPAGAAAAPLGLPPASGEILIHRSHGCSSNPPADAPFLLPRQPATWLLRHARVSVRLTRSVRPFVRPSVRQASVMKNLHGHLKGQYAITGLPIRRTVQGPRNNI